MYSSGGNWGWWEGNLPTTSPPPTHRPRSGYYYRLRPGCRTDGMVGRWVDGCWLYEGVGFGLERDVARVEDEEQEEEEEEEQGKCSRRETDAYDREIVSVLLRRMKIEFRSGFENVQYLIVFFFFFFHYKWTVKAVVSL